ncbi:SMC family ATPase [Candidatus Dependentiae bacterium]|nr:MAG: SMC family ATPase [Candidatus Dependentiae bacterium]
MIPHSLFIKNFLSYGAKGEHVSFDPYHLICLSGKNGHGKSALLDALTWAIWGQARKTLQSVKPDQGLLRLGQSQMVVIVEFSCNGQRYRIRREYMYHHSKPYAQLDFGLLEDGKLIPLTDKTIKATQQAIINTIKLDYEGFCNTVFLKQGASNEFSKKSAKERKELLASILGLNTYENVRKLALNKIKAAHIEHRHILNMVQRLTKDSSNYDELQRVYTQNQEYLSTVQQKIVTHAELFKKIDDEKKLFYEAEHQLQQYIATYNETVSQLAQLQQELAETYRCWRIKKKQQACLPDIGVLLKKKTELLEIIQEQQQLHALTLAVKESLICAKQQKQDHEKKIKDACAIIEQECLQATQSLEKELQENVFHLRSIENMVTEQQKQLAEIDKTMHMQDEESFSYGDLQTIILKRENELDRKKTVYQKMVAYGNMLSNKHKDLLLKIGATNDIHNPSCPLCEQNLSLARKKFLRAKCEKEASISSHQIKRFTRILPLLKNLIISDHQTIEALKKEALAATTKQHAFDELMRKKILIEMHYTDTQESLKTINTKIATLSNQIQAKKEYFAKCMPSLDNDQSYKDIVKNIDTLSSQALACQYKQQIHEKALVELKQVHIGLALYENQDKLTDTNNTIIHTMRDYINKIRIIKAEKAKKLVHITEQKKVVTLYENVHEKINSWRKEQEKLIFEKEELIKSTTGLYHQLEQCTKIVTEIKNLEHSAELAQQTVEDYNAIATATGKDGIQALLIEEAIPSIEHEANKLLAKLTQNNARIFIDSLKDLKNGGTKETLDIKIADNAGIRPYELFSGGEAFRIDFALRIAVSTLLAQKAGTSLQTLIIDEGFGSQDEEGLQLITNTLQKIQNSFAKIIIVSHLPNMKDQFPVHFIIDKTTHGSKIQVLEL